MPAMIKNLINKCYKCGEKDPSNFYPSDHKRCKKCSRDYNKDYRKKNKEKIKLQRTEYQRKVRQKIINALGGKCIKCGFSDWRALQIDHINGGGVKELRSRKSWMQYYTNVLDNPDKYQLLCANCNWIKRYEENENGLQEGVGNG